MNSVFQPYLRKFIIVFFDDILIYNKTYEEHLCHLEQTFQTLMAGQFFLKLSKCSFAQTLMEYLGHMVSKSGVEPLQEKVQAVQQWPTPCSVKAVRGFLGLSGFYRRFIKEYVTIAVPLTQLLAKD